MINYLLEKGIDPCYVTQFYHGEQLTSNNLSSKSCDEGQSVGNEEYDDHLWDEDDGVTEILFDLNKKYTQSKLR